MFKLFGEHQQRKNQNETGVGLGLTIVKKLIVIMDGQIDLESELGFGTKIEFKIPARTR